MANDLGAKLGLLTLEEALHNLRQGVTPITETEIVPLALCDGRILAKAVISRINVPPHDNSAMDGYALRAAELSSTDILPVAGESFAGHPYNGECPSGYCIRIMTGATIPAGTDTVVMQEQTEPTPEGIRFFTKPAPNNNIRQAGEDIAQDSTVLPTGHRLRPQDIGLLASLGFAEVPVYRKLKVAVFSTGDELKLPGEPLGHGDIYDSNRIIITTMLNRLHVDVLDLGKLPDDRTIIRQALEQANRVADAVITSGGVSVGDADYTREVLEELGETRFWKLAIKPGKPFAFGQLSESVFFGLPGNPVSATITLHIVAIPALRILAGEQFTPAPAFNATTHTRLKKAPGRCEFQRGILACDELGNAAVVTTGSQGSGILRSMNIANCYIILPEESRGAEVGEQVLVLPFDNLLA